MKKKINYGKARTTVQGDVRNGQGDVRNGQGDVRNGQGDIRNGQGTVVRALTSRIFFFFFFRLIC
jgi:hypothetical protein